MGTKHKQSVTHTQSQPLKRWFLYGATLASVSGGLWMITTPAHAATTVATSESITTAPGTAPVESDTVAATVTTSTATETAVVSAGTHPATISAASTAIEPASQLPVTETSTEVSVRQPTVVKPVAPARAQLVTSTTPTVASTMTIASEVQKSSTPEVAKGVAVVPLPVLESGTYGTSPWKLTGDNTLTFDAGTFPPPNPALGKGSFAEQLTNPQTVKTIVINPHVIAATDSHNLFSQLPNLETVIGLSNLDVSHVTTMYQLFNGDTKLQTADVSGWNISSVTNLDQAFAQTALRTLDVSKWDTSHVTSMNEIFSQDHYLNGLDVSRWDTSQVTSMLGLFNENFVNTALDVSHWNTAKVTNMANLFARNSSLESLDISNWDVSQVMNFSGMFYQTAKLKTLDVSRWQVGKAMDLSLMFFGSGVSQLDVVNWDTSHATNLNMLFGGLTNVASLDLSRWNVGAVTTAQFMFIASKLKQLNAKGLNFAATTDTQFLFPQPSELYELILGPKTSFGTASGLADVPGNQTAYGNGLINDRPLWQAVGTGTLSAPNGKTYTAAQLMALYAVPGGPDETYVWATTQYVPITIKLVNAKTGTPMPQATVTVDLAPVWGTVNLAETAKLPDFKGYAVVGTPLPTDYQVKLADNVVNLDFAVATQTLTVAFKTSDGTVIDTATLDGAPGSTVTLAGHIPAGYQLVDPPVINFTDDVTQQVTLTVVPIPKAPATDPTTTGPTTTDPKTTDPTTTGPTTTDPKTTDPTTTGPTTDPKTTDPTTTGPTTTGPKTTGPTTTNPTTGPTTTIPQTPGTVTTSNPPSTLPPTKQTVPQPPTAPGGPTTSETPPTETVMKMPPVATPPTTGTAPRDPQSPIAQPRTTTQPRVSDIGQSPVAGQQRLTKETSMTTNTTETLPQTNQKTETLTLFGTLLLALTTLLGGLAFWRRS